MIVYGLVSGWRQRLAIAALQQQPASTGLVDLAAKNMVAKSAADAEAELSRVSDFARLDVNATTTTNLDSIAQAGFQHKTAKNDIRSVLHDDQWGIQRGEYEPRTGEVGG